MDVVALGMAKADAKKNYAPRLEAARRRPGPMSLIPATIATTLPTVTIAKGSGASAIAVASGGSGYVVGDRVTMAGGTFTAPAIGNVTSVSGGAITAVAVDTAGLYTVTPSNPVSQASTSGSGTGATFTVTWNGGVGATMATPAAFGVTNTAFFRFTGAGPANIGGSGYYGDSVQNGTACTWEWTTDASKMDIKLSGSNTKAVLFVNGQRIDTNGITTDASGAGYLYSLDWAGVAVPRTYKLFAVNSAFKSVATNSTAKVWAPIEPRKPLAYGLGDSYMFGTGATTVADAAFDHMCQFLGLEGLPDGIGGSGWNSAGATAPATRATNKLTALTYKPDYVFLDLGYNDAGGNMTTLAASFDATVTAIKAAVPKAKIIAFGPATPLGATANLTLVKNAVSARCTAGGIPFIDVENWVDGTNKSVYTDVDNVHPKPAGHAYIGARKAQAVASYL
jgi:lysophospholipase L1-like esterase